MLMPLLLRSTWTLSLLCPKAVGVLFIYVFIYSFINSDNTKSYKVAKWKGDFLYIFPSNKGMYVTWSVMSLVSLLTCHPVPMSPFVNQMKKRCDFSPTLPGLLEQWVHLIYLYTVYQWKSTVNCTLWQDPGFGKQQRPFANMFTFCLV